MRVGIVGQRGNARAEALVEELHESLPDDVERWIDEHTAGVLDIDGVAPERMEECDLLVSVGGDGTFLFAARAGGTTPILGVNLGEVGFLNAVAPRNAIETVREAVEQLRTGDLPVRETPRLRAAGDGWRLPPAINEVVVQGPRRGPGGGAEIEVRIDGSLYAGGWGDGALVATPTGSTAYNLSEGGPLLHPDVGGLVVTGMCVTDHSRPIVIDPTTTIDVRIGDTDDGYTIVDGRERRSLDPPATVTVAVDDEPLRIAGPATDFFQALGKIG